MEPTTPAEKPENVTDQGKPPVEVSPAPEATPPPATKIVVEATKSEREIELETKLTAAEERAKQAEIAAGHALNQVEELKKIPATPGSPAPTKRKRKKGIMENFFNPGEDESEA